MTLTEPLFIERNPFRMEIIELLKGKFWASVWRIAPERQMVWLGGPFDSEGAAYENAEPHFEALIPKALSFALRSQFAYAVSELPGVVAMLERSGRHDEARRVRNVLELMGQRISEAA